MAYYAIINSSLTNVNTHFVRTYMHILTNACFYDLTGMN